uniref:Uncharacterized protein n=1 Tax=Rhizophora mucronata TaxID=61149 RepID=A0A2P2PWN5_RHIMU
MASSLRSWLFSNLKKMITGPIRIEIFSF